MRRLTIGSWVRLPMLTLLALILSAGLSPRVYAQHHVTRLLVNQTATQSLTLIKPTDPSFESMLDTDYPGLSDEDGYQTSIRPFLVILENDSGSVAMAYAITWELQYTDGSSRSLQAVYINRPFLDAGAMTYIPPGGVHLIAPMFNLTSNHYGWFQSFAQAYPASRFPRSNDLSSVEASVDGVVYADGTFIGPDTTRIFQRYVAARFAARDEALEALALITSSPAPLVVQQLQQRLNQEVQWAMEADKGTLLTLYVAGRGNTAADLRSILLARGLAGLEKDLQNFVSRSGEDASPSMFDGVYRKLSPSDPAVFGPVSPSPSGSTQQ